MFKEIKEEWAATIDSMVAGTHRGVKTEQRGNDTYFILDIAVLKTTGSYSNVVKALQTFQGLHDHDNIWRIEGGWKNPYTKK